MVESEERSSSLHTILKKPNQLATGIVVQQVKTNVNFLFHSFYLFSFCPDFPDATRVTGSHWHLK
jgi:hypothetical protein